VAALKRPAHASEAGATSEREPPRSCHVLSRAQFEEFAHIGEPNTSQSAASSSSAAPR
jgi:hypothetical protein